MQELYQEQLYQDKILKVALAQVSLSPSVAENYQKALRQMDVAAERQANLICFPELQLSPFFPQYPGQDVQHYAFSIEDPIIQEFQAKAKQLGLAAVLNVYLQENGQYYDASPVLDRAGSLLGISKMVHVAQLPCFYEQDYYTPSDSGFRVYDLGVCKVGVVVCFDRHYPESVRACALQGAEMVVIPTANIEGEPLDLFESEVRVAALQNNVFIAMCNRVGVEGDVTFCGQSIVVDPNGTVLKKADAQEQLICVELNLAQVVQSRIKRPFVQLRRPEAYQSLCL